MQKIIDYLLENAGESIQYRVRREILGVPPQSAEMTGLHERILCKPKVRKILAARQEDGWIGNSLHGSPPDGLDSNAWKLLNYGVEKGHAVFLKAAHALLHPKKDEPYKRTFPGGPALDADGRGGDRAVVAKILASLDYESEDIVAREVKLSLDHFRGALKHTSVDDFSTATRSGSRRYYKPGVRFPGSNHFGLLNATKGWRTPENMEMVRDSFAHCLGLMQGHPEVIFFKSGSHFVGPFNFSWHRFPFSMAQLQDDSYAFVWWLRILDNLSTIGFTREVPQLAAEYEHLQELLDSRAIYEEQTEKSLQRFREIWSIEDTWRREEQVKSDLFFWAALILSRAGYMD